ncbi:nuclear transport factor 2 family protein [Nocardia sp. NPDC059240]|uniref:nuclear transport factor 2 family protein n=1 Tax=Nocardia sp. NPDC059240 TaxID=3346786 RepID=UPI003684DAB8
MPLASDRVQQLLDRADLGDLVAGITGCLDRKDFGRLHRYYAPDAVLRMADVVCVSVEEIVAVARKNHEMFWQTQHLVAGVTVSIAGDQARVVANVVAVLMPGPHGADIHLMGSRYELAATRIESRWVADEHVIVPLWDLRRP